jgi:hypothetical protein
MAVNRGGFLGLILSPEGEGDGGKNRIALHWVPEAYWENYTVASLFEYRDNPAVLLYRNDFFIDSPVGVPEKRLWGLDTGLFVPLELHIPAFSLLSPGEGWDLENLRRGRDGFWYYRAVRKTRDPPELAYFRTPDPDTPGESSSAGVFRNAAVPYTMQEASPGLGRALERAVLRLNGNGGVVAEVVSPDFAGLRYYSAGDFAGEGDSGLVELAGYCRGGGALVVFPGGEGFYAPGEDAEVSAFSLPPLPEGFVYTRIGPLGRFLAAAWEEQDGWSVGASGFLVIAGPETP